ncbi:ankyrin [Paxillus ammoniavirescens]|nr:ankyrin [Paxillus ammoniavirescens]
MGADINLQADHPEDPEESLTPLHIACYYGCTTIVELLLQNGVDLAAQSKSLNTALHFASRHGRLDILRLLLRKGADPNVQNKDLQTPLDLARNKVDGYVVHGLPSVEDYNEIVAVLSAATPVLVTTHS